jgi:hypothetical protein
VIGGRRALGVGRELVAWAAGRRDRYRVAGPSMEPTLLDGEFVLIEPARVPTTGELALVTVPGLDGVDAVKRVAEIMADGSFRLLSDNPELGTDSRRWGPLAPSSVRGTVTLNLSRLLALEPGSTSDGARGSSIGRLRRRAPRLR